MYRKCSKKCKFSSWVQSTFLHVIYEINTCIHNEIWCLFNFTQFLANNFLWCNQVTSLSVSYFSGNITVFKRINHRMEISIMEVGLLLTTLLWNLLRIYSTKWLWAAYLVRSSIISNIEMKMKLATVDRLSFCSFVGICTSGLWTGFSPQEDWVIFILNLHCFLKCFRKTCSQTLI